MDKVKRRGYHSFETQGGNKVELLFTMLFWGRLEEKGYTLESVQETLNGSGGVLSQLKCIGSILSAAHSNLCAKDNIDNKFTDEDFLEMLEEDVTEDILKAVLETMMGTKIFGNEVRQSGKSKVAKKSPA